MVMHRSHFGGSYPHPTPFPKGFNHVISTMIDKIQFLARMVSHLDKIEETHSGEVVLTRKLCTQIAEFLNNTLSWNKRSNCFNERIMTLSPPACKPPVNQQSHEGYLLFHRKLCQLPQHKALTVPQRSQRRVKNSLGKMYQPGKFVHRLVNVSTALTLRVLLHSSNTSVHFRVTRSHGDFTLKTIIKTTVTCHHDKTHKPTRYQLPRCAIPTPFQTDKSLWGIIIIITFRVYYSQINPQANHHLHGNLHLAEVEVVTVATVPDQIAEVYSHSDEDHDSGTC